MGNKKITIGILAHVDAGKTTLSEAILFNTGIIRKLGRVDHGDTFLDTDAIERERGITVFSKQAGFSYKNTDFYLLDTPGHTDFSAEAERALWALDYAVLVISGTDGVQSHTQTIWELLKKYQIPTFIFVNKMDISQLDKSEIMKALRERLDISCFDFGIDDKSVRDQNLALTSDRLFEAYGQNDQISDYDVALEITERKLTPCFFGSALKLHGVTELLDALDLYTLQPDYPIEFGARVYKIIREGNTRLTCLKLTGGELSVRTELKYISSGGVTVSEKVSQIRIYSGDKFIQTDKVSAGDICAVAGLDGTFAGQGLGSELRTELPTLQPVLTYRIKLPDGCDPKLFYPKLKALEEEDPMLNILWESELQEIRIRLMGEVQTEIIKRIISDRFSVDAEIDEGSILYKETVSNIAEGVGHYEPLRHYAEVHLLIEPLPAGSGLVFDSKCPLDLLDLNWQRLIMSNLREKLHRGVLIGAPLTDVKLTLIAGRAHLKHTEGGDFREAVIRAVRQGLMCAQSVLLEPFYKFRLEIPQENLGRAISDLVSMDAEYENETTDSDFSVLSGRAAVSRMRGYIKDVSAYTHGKGRLVCTFGGYYPCKNADEVIAASGYDPEADRENPPHSVFCAHGAGFVVPWHEVRNYMHIDSGFSKQSAVREVLPSVRSIAGAYRLDDKELEALMMREFGPVRRRQYGEKQLRVVGGKNRHFNSPPKLSKLIIDGYNVIFQWDFLNSIAEYDLSHARETLLDIISNYVSFTKTDVVLVFDAYRVKGNIGREEEYNGFTVVYTAQDQTADAYIEKLMYKLGPDHTIRVVTSDRLIQLSAVHSGIFRLSAREFLEEIQRVNIEITEFINTLKELE